MTDEQLKELYGKINKLEDKELKKLVSELIEELKKDELTSTYNRRVLDDNIKYDIIAICDIDNFKDINDIYGHSTGDKVLMLIADRLKSMIRNDDIVCRYGGDEFVIIFRNCSSEDVINRINEIKENILDKNVVPNVTISFGITEYEHNKFLTQAINEADMALYNSKREGKNKITNYNDLNNKVLNKNI